MKASELHLLQRKKRAKNRLPLLYHPTVPLYVKGVVAYACQRLGSIAIQKVVNINVKHNLLRLMLAMMMMMNIFVHNYLTERL